MLLALSLGSETKNNMRVVDISLHEPQDRALAEALVSLTEGGVVAFPTETAYGLAAIPTNASGVEKIYAIKGRDRSKPLPLIAATTEDVEKLIEISDQLDALIHKYWPGPLTIVAPIKKRLAGQYESVLGPNNTVAIRVSSLEIARLLAAAAGGIITSTSANLSNQPTIYSGDEVRHAYFQQKIQPNIILNAGALPQRPTSTIVQEQNGKIVVIREGAIKIKP